MDENIRPVLIMISNAVNERKYDTYAAHVATKPSQIKTTLAIASPLSLYCRGGSSTNSMPVALPTNLARFVDKITVNTIAEESVKIHDRIEQAFHAIRTDLDSCLSGQNRSKKNAAPKMVATKTPVKMLYENAPMIS